MTHHRGGFCSINSIQPLLSQVTNGRHAYCAHRASGWDLSKRSVSQKELLADGQHLEKITVFFKCVLATGIPFLQTMIFFGFNTQWMLPDLIARLPSRHLQAPVTDTKPSSWLGRLRLCPVVVSYLPSPHLCAACFRTCFQGSQVFIVIYLITGTTSQ